MLKVDRTLVDVSAEVLRVSWDWSEFCLLLLWFFIPLFIDCRSVSVRAWRLGLIRSVGALCVWDGCLLFWGVVGGFGGVALCVLFVPCWTISGLVARRSDFISVHGKFPLLR